MQTATTDTMAEREGKSKRGGVPGKRFGTAEREAMVTALREQGTPTDAIAKALGISVGSVYNINQRVRKNGNNPLLTPRRIKNATKAIDAFVQGKRVGGEVDPDTGEVKGGVLPKCSTVLAAANVVLDRAYPKAQEDAGKGNISFTQVNISLAGTPIPEPVDVTPNPLGPDVADPDGQ